MSFSAHETLVCFLIRELQKEPLPGFSRVNLTQFRRRIENATCSWRA